MDPAQLMHIMRLQPHYYSNVEAVAVADPTRRSLSDDDIARIIKSYIFSIGQFDTTEASLWNSIIFPKHKSFHESLLAGNIAQTRATLADPTSSDLLYGFYENFTESFQAITSAQAGLDGYGQFCMDRLVALATALGACRSWNPEHADATMPAAKTADQVLDAIEHKLGGRLTFPNIFDRNFGLRTSRGLLNDRAVHAIYLVHRINSLCARRHGASILEIGAGLGHSAYYARRLGIDRYTIVDIPITTVCQAYYLMNTLGPEIVALPGEVSRHRHAPVRIWSPEEFFGSGEVFDLIANVDSITEMGKGTAHRYVAELGRRTRIFLSINHESNEFRFLDLCRDQYRRDPDLRMQYWLRRGYLEEVIRFNPPERTRRLSTWIRAKMHATYRKLAKLKRGWRVGA